MEKKILPLINDYRLNRFVINVDIQDGWILYNTVTGSIVVIYGEDDLHKSLDELIKMNYYVPITFDEISWVNGLRSARNSAPKEQIINGFTILTTTDCNARCFYCYEKGQPKISMTEKTAIDVADFILSVSSNSPVDLRWFGGEPLFNPDVIDIICNKLTDKDVKFKSTMVSNGLLITDAIISRAKKLWNLKNVQISLDGTKNVYQKAKAYKHTVGDEFDRVIENISKLANSDIHVSIRLNQDIYNTADLLELVDFLCLKFGGNKQVSVYNNWLYGDNNKSDVIPETEKYEKFKELQNKIIECGLLRSNPLRKKFRFCHCMADNDSSVLITPNGDIGKCEHFTNQHLIGTIYDSKFDMGEIEKWKEIYQPTQKCFDCPLYPQCYRIKMCPVEKDLCSLTECENKIELIKRTLLQKYKSAKEYR